ncbi:MAG: hypothetical protein IIC26_03295 [Chloroflexi bacterium]|nr:hypothetical protein [Chloroflexota bacterium]
MWTIADYFGIMAYLWIMYGGPPDQAMVSAALRMDTSTLERPPSFAAVLPQPLADEAASADKQSERVAA